ncbi:MAG: glycosyltransferase family 2 protein [Bacteroidota bacterium]
MTSDSIDISLVIPLYNEDESIEELVGWINKVFKSFNKTYEIILVDDGSDDNSWKIIEQLSLQFSFVKGVKFLSNKGKSVALDAGFNLASGNVVITMDADLQDSPEEIPELYRMIIEDDYDMVSGWKKKRFDPITKTIPSRLFNKVTQKISGIPLHDFNCGLKAYKAEVVHNIRVYGEMHRYIPVIAKWHGFRKIGEKVVQHQPRKYGVTKFGLERFINGFLDLLSITFVSKFKQKPMHFFGTVGTLFFMIGSIITIFLISEKLYYNLYLNVQARSVVDKPHFFLALTSLIIGVQLFLAGFIGELVSTSSMRKADYQIAEKVGFND